jgi:hypothetical protein
MIKYFLKWLKLVPSSNGSSDEIAYVFLDRVFTRFGVLLITNTNFQIYE